MAFQQALSGLNTAAKAIDSTSHNIANSSTVGYKSSVAHFADVYAASLTGAGASQVGIGASLAAIQQQFTQGNITATNNPLDISINGNGFFRMNNGGDITYARNGQFHLDNAGFIINDQGMRLMGYQADANGVISPSGDPVDMQLSASQIRPRATSDPLAGDLTANLNLDSRLGVAADLDPTPAVTAAANTVGAAAQAAAQLGGATAATTRTAADTARNAFAPGTPERAAADAVVATIDAAIAAALPAVLSAADVATAATSSTTVAAALAAGQTAAIPGVTAGFNPQLPGTYNFSTALSVYDTLGVAHTMTMYFQRESAGGNWNVFATLDGADPQQLTDLAFNTSGALTSAMPMTLPSWTLTSGAQSPWSPGEINFTGTTQYGSASSVDRMTQGGFATGSLTGLSVSGDGVVQGRYSNGQARNLGQVVLATFANPNGLQSLGNNQWSRNSVSGPELLSAPGAGGRGVLQSSSVEESNVDLTAELVNLITYQRNYQANAQSIKTQDQVLQTLVNLR